MKIQVDISVDAKTLKRQLTFQPSFPCLQIAFTIKHLRLIFAIGTWALTSHTLQEERGPCVLECGGGNHTNGGMVQYGYSALWNLGIKYNVSIP